MLSGSGFASIIAARPLVARECGCLAMPWPSSDVLAGFPPWILSTFREELQLLPVHALKKEVEIGDTVALRKFPLTSR